MKRWAFALLAIGIMGCQEKKPEHTEVNLEDKVHKRSYGIGMDIANMLKQQGIEVNIEVFMQGFKDRYKDEATLMNQEEINKTLAELQQEKMAEQQASQDKISEDNKTKGAAFLAENKNKEGVVTLASGLQYKVITQGSGPKPKNTDEVTFHYKGTLMDGTVFDESYGRGQPATLRVDQLIPGWIEALQLMPVGSKWELYVPGMLAYGARPGGPGGPNSTLIFQVELLNIKK